MVDIKTLKSVIHGKNVLVDTNIIIYLTEEIAPYYRLSRALFSLIEEGVSTGVISLLSIGEIMQGPIKSGKTDIAMDIKKYLLNFPHLHCQAVSTAVLDLMGTDERVEWKKLRPMDALIIACGLYSQVDLFISDDRHFISALPPSMMLSFR